MKKLFLLLLLPLTVQAELKALDEQELVSVIGQGITIDARLDFAGDTNLKSVSDPQFNNSNWFSYRRTLYDHNGNSLLNASGDYKDNNNNGYVDNTGNNNDRLIAVASAGSDFVGRQSWQDGRMRVPYYITFGKITGGILIEGLEFNLTDLIEYSSQVQGQPKESNDKAALKWTLPDKISFDQFKIDGVFVSKEQDLNAAGNDINRVIGLQAHGDLFMPSNPKAYVFITNN